MIINWLKLGYQVVTLIVTGSITLAFGALVFQKYMAPSINEALQEATTTAKQLASLGGIKKEGWTASKNIEKAVARDIINEKIPELEAFKVFLSPATWEEIQDTIDSNPEAILQLWDKYGHLVGGLGEQQKQVLDF